jgi:hypothetical protein
VSFSDVADWDPLKGPAPPPDSPPEEVPPGDPAAGPPSKPSTEPGPPPAGAARSDPSADDRESADVADMKIPPSQASTT